MKTGKTAALIMFIILLLPSLFKAQVISGNGEGVYISGYEKDVKGEILGYHSPLASVNSSLLVRSISEKNYIEWETAKVPAGFNGSSASFVWMFGVEAKPETHKFNLFINDKYILSFNNPKDTTVLNWSVNGADSVQLIFDATMVDRYGDLMGFACLKVPKGMYKTGEPLTVKIAGESLNRNTWYMTFRHSIDNNIRAFTQPVVINSKPVNTQPVTVEVIHFTEPVKGVINIDGKKYDVNIRKGFNKYDFTIPVEKTARDVNVSFEFNNAVRGKTFFSQEPVKQLTIYLLHHSHNDIGYTHIQSDVVKMQIKNLKDAIEAIDDSKQNPDGARMKWNSEVVWPVLQYLRNCSKDEIAKLKKAVKDGSIEVNALYANMLTGLCRPEELMQVLEPGRKIYEEFGVKPKSAMISDVPGLSWGVVPVLAQYGIKYLEIGQNQGDRIGNTLSTWGDKPFYWVSPSGKEKLLCFTAGQGYSFFHAGLNYGKLVNPLKEEKLSYYLEQLRKEQYPYDILPIHYTVGSDNGPVHKELPAIVKAWNDKYASPKIIISTTGDFFKAFESKYGGTIPTVRGDYTGSWDDGAASTARETAMNRRSADRIVQAEALYSITGDKKFPSEEIDKAWENVLLYSEHTWGSWNSMSDPENDFTKQQWAVKRSFSLKADSISKNLVNNALLPKLNDADAVDVYNTNSFACTGWVKLETGIDLEGKMITNGKGEPVPFQVMKNGDVMLFAENVPQLGSKRYFIAPLTKKPAGSITLEGNTLSNGIVSVTINPANGNISSLTLKGVNQNFVNEDKTNGLADYEYVNGRRPDKFETPQNVRIVRGEEGPFIKSIKIISDAPGCNSLEKEITLYEGMNKVDINITVDRKKVYSPEGIHIAFPFNIPGAYDYINTAWATYRPEYDQVRGACKNYFPVQRFVDVSNEQLGITLTTTDAPMAEIGEIRTDGNIYGWIKKIDNSPTVYSYIMNNYWGTNYKAEQEGVTGFSYTLLPHLRRDMSENEKAALAVDQPMIASPVSKNEKEHQSLFTLESDKAVVTLVKPSRDGKGLIVRLFNTSIQPAEAGFKWGSFKAKGIYYSNPDEKPLKKIEGAFKMLPNEIATIKLEKK